MLALREFVDQISVDVQGHKLHVDHLVQHQHIQAREAPEQPCGYCAERVPVEVEPLKLA